MCAVLTQERIVNFFDTMLKQTDKLRQSRDQIMMDLPTDLQICTVKNVFWKSKEQYSR